MTKTLQLRLFGQGQSKALAEIDEEIENVRLGQAASGLTDFQAGRKYLIEALQVTFGARLIPQILDTLFDFASLLVKESNLADMSEPARLQQRALALAQLVLITHHPQAKQVNKDRANQLIAHLETELPTDIVAIAKAQGNSQTLEEMIKEILPTPNQAT